MVERNKEVYGNFDFDGFQIDQLGYRGTVYDANQSKGRFAFGVMAHSLMP